MTASSDEDDDVYTEELVFNKDKHSESSAPEPPEEDQNSRLL